IRDFHVTGVQTCALPIYKLSLMNADHSNRPSGQPPDRDRLSAAFGHLAEVIARLRSPEGCPWDREQTLASIKPYTLEETYELLRSEEHTSKLQSRVNLVC